MSSGRTTPVARVDHEGAAVFILAIPILIAVVVIVTVQRHRAANELEDRTADPAVVAALVDRWRGAALISPDQAAAIAEYERAHAPVEAPPVSHAPVVAEVLGYVGAILAAIGIAIVVARVDLSLQTGALLALVLGAVLIAAGFAVPEAAGGPWWRFHQVLWTLGLAGLTIAAGIQVGGVAEHSGQAVALACGAVGAIVGGLLYARRDRPAQLVMWFAGLIAAVVGGAMLLADGGVLVAAGLLLLGAAWTAAAWRGLLPRRMIAVPLGATLLGVAAAPASDGWGQFVGFGLATLVCGALILVGHRLRTSGGAGLLVPGIAVATFVASGALTGTDTTNWQQALTATVLVAFGATAIRETWDDHDAEGVAVQLTGAAALLVPPGYIWASIDMDSGPALVALLAGVAIGGVLTALGALRTRPWLAGAGLLGILIYVPWTVAQFFEGKAVPVTLVLVGLLGIGAAVRSLRHRATPPTAPPLLGP